MTECTDDNWPEEYRDPRDRPHPTMLSITAASVEEDRDDTRAAVDALEVGEEQPEVVSVHSVGDLRQILTESIAPFAANPDRDYTAVHDDVSLLASYGCCSSSKTSTRGGRTSHTSGSISRSNSSATGLRRRDDEVHLGGQSPGDYSSGVGGSFWPNSTSIRTDRPARSG